MENPRKFYMSVCMWLKTMEKTTMRTMHLKIVPFYVPQMKFYGSQRLLGTVQIIMSSCSLVENHETIVAIDRDFLEDVALTPGP